MYKLGFVSLKPTINKIAESAESGMEFSMSGIKTILIAEFFLKMGEI